MRFDAIAVIRGPGVRMPARFNGSAALMATIPLPDPERERAKSHGLIRGELPSATNPPPGCRFHTRCPRAGDICQSVEPPLRPFGERHLAACHFPLQEPVEGSSAA